MTEPTKSIIIRIVSSAMVPFMQLFALYVITHGHYGPGGGFQGGVILAVSIMLLRLSLGKEVSYQKFSPELAAVVATIGILVFMLVGLIPLARGGMFLDYEYLPIPGMSGAALRSFGILIVEVGIGLAVFGTMVLIFDRLVEAER